jgi:hypothetical protein
LLSEFGGDDVGDNGVTGCYVLDCLVCDEVVRLFYDKFVESFG